MKVDYYEFGVYRLKTEPKEYSEKGHGTYLLYKNGKEIEINQNEFAVLAKLAEAEGNKVDKGTMVNKKWSSINADELLCFDSDGKLYAVKGLSISDGRSVEQIIRSLRVKMDDSAKKQEVISTSGSHYSLIPKVKIIYKNESEEQFNEKLQETNNRDEIAPSQLSPETIINPNDDMKTFTDWLSGRGRGITVFFSFAALLTIIISALFFFRSNDMKKGADAATICASFTHIILLGIALFYLWRFSKSKDFLPKVKLEKKEDKIKSTGYKNFQEWDKADADVRTSNTLKNYKAQWSSLLVIWWFFYAALAVITYYNYGELDRLPPDHQLWINLFNNLNTLWIFVCFSILYNGTVPKKERHNPITIIVIGIFVIVTLLFADIYSPNDNFRVFLKIISGTAGGIGMGLFVARLQSKFLKISLWLLIPLYLYIVIQPLFVFIGNTEAVNILPMLEPVIIHLALILKCVLILYMFWIFESGRLLFYLVRVRRTKDEVENWWQDFRQLLE